ncbi:ABC transporter substrate-binding protein [Gordoniibacillus kamchatkensis]|uniref:ABC transporter substrate-binding protein n=1 Tax=Gordoniibacillus kamchatkensis TaxID=1590651 RepID=A0ABR5ADH4_9BACL|nr:extracellular solute-binding protein [Paenibacillus sp. VKM B-2647]KIL39005.1 ABC transporter substrate-binding protein [Paenibacillus sp. VKM B-2647]
MKKTIIVSLVAVMALSVLAGCGGGTKTEESQGKADAPAKPLKFSLSLPVTTTAGYQARVTDWKNDKLVKQLEKLTNTELTVRITEDSKMSVMFAGNDIPDVVGSIGTPTSKSMAGSVEAGVFMPLDDLLKQYAPNLMKKVPKAAWDAVSHNGKIYGIPDYLSNPSRRGTYIRTDLLEKAGLKPPQTIDEFLNVLRAFKKMGVENPYQMRDSFKYADVVLGAYDVLPYKDQFEVVNGQVQPKFFDVDNMEKALQTYKTMLDEGLIPKDFATISSADYSKSINSGKAGAWSANATGLISFRTPIRQVVPDAKVDIIPSPKGPEGKGGYFFYIPAVRTFYINKNVDKERAIGIVKFYEWMTSEEAEKFFTFGIEGENYTLDNGKMNYKIPTTKEEQEEESFRQGTLWMGQDATLSPPRKRLELDQNGKDVLSAFDNVLNMEGLPGIGFYPDLTAFAKYPDLAPPQPDVGPKLIIDHMVKMIYGKEPIADWPKVIEEYKAKGGNEILKEANERYSKKEGVLEIKR